MSLNAKMYHLRFPAYSHKIISFRTFLIIRW